MRILVADNNSLDRIDLVQAIEKLNHNVIESLSRSEILSICRYKCPNLMFIGDKLVNIETIRQIRQLGGHASWNNIIIISEKMEEFEQLKWIEAGVDDILIKPISLFRLKIKINAAVRQFNLKTDVFSVAHSLVVSNRALENIVIQDTLTGVANSNGFEDALEREWFIARKKRLPLSLMHLNVDYFHLYNKIYGVKAGDQVLIKICDLLKNLLSQEYYLARISGPTFALIMPNVDSEEALNLGNKIVLEIQALNIQHLHSGCSDRITMSIGISTVSEDNFNEPWDLTEATDYALYQAKHQGKNKCCFETTKINA